MIEIKTDKGKLTADQAYLHRYWPGHIAIARNLEEVLEIVRRETV